MTREQRPELESRALGSEAPLEHTVFLNGQLADRGDASQNLESPAALSQTPLFMLFPLMLGSLNGVMTATHNYLRLLALLDMWKKPQVQENELLAAQKQERMETQIAEQPEPKKSVEQPSSEHTPLEQGAERAHGFNLNLYSSFDIESRPLESTVSVNLDHLPFFLSPKAPGSSDQSETLHPAGQTETQEVPSSPLPTSEQTPEPDPTGPGSQHQAPTDILLSNNSVLDNIDLSSAYTIGYLSAVDADAGDAFTYTISGGADAAVFQINGAELQFKPGTELVYKTQNTYEVFITATDSANESYTKHFIVSIGDGIAPVVGFFEPDTSLRFVQDVSSTVDNPGFTGMASTEVTLELWVKGSNVFDGNNGTLFDFVAGNSHELAIAERGQVVYVKNTPYLIGADVTDGFWHHIALTWDSATGTLNYYFDGQLYGTVGGVSVGDSLASTGNFLLGIMELGGALTRFPGEMAEVRLWDKALTEEDIQANLFNHLTGNEDGLIGLWPMNTGSGTLLHDLTGHNDLFIGANNSWVSETVTDTPSIFTGGGAVPVISGESVFSVSDQNSSHLEGATVTIKNLQDAGFELLTVVTAGTNITASYNAAIGVLTLSGTDTLYHYQQVLNSVTYNNTAASPNTTAREISFTVTDGTNTSNTWTQTVQMQPTLSTDSFTAPGIVENVLLNIAGVQVTHADATQVQMFLKVDTGTLTLGIDTGLTFANGSSNGGSWMSFYGSLKDVNAALRTLQYVSSEAGTATLEAYVLGFENAEVNTIGKIFYNPANGHFYELVTGPNLAFEDLMASAANRNVGGMSGYLATISSADEQAFLQNAFSAAALSGAALGGSDLGNEGVWYWVSGPEGEANGGQGTAFSYTDWSASEPSNWLGNEHSIAFASDGSGKWNDVYSFSGGLMLVEYGGLSTDSHIGTMDISVEQSGGPIAMHFDIPILLTIGGNFTGRAGEMIWYVNSGDLTIAVDLEGNGSGRDGATFQVRLEDFEVFLTSMFSFHQVVGTEANDILTVYGTDTNVMVNGGGGDDLLTILGSGLNLDSSFFQNISGISRIGINGSGTNQLTLTLEDVLDISTSNETLYIDGGTDDTLIFAGGGWAAGPTDVFTYGNFYNAYTKDGTTVYVDTDLSLIL